MIVIDHVPADWFLLRADNRYWLDINCTISATGFSLLLALNATEQADVLADGHAACARLAYRCNGGRTILPRVMSAPVMVRRSPQRCGRGARQAPATLAHELIALGKPLALFAARGCNAPR
nr:hypothetical protein [Xanthomonas axonopodis]